MGHLSILMSIKVHYNQHTFTCLEFSNYTTLNQKKLFFFKFGKVKIVKVHKGLKFVTYRFVIKALNRYFTLLSDNGGGRKIYKTTGILDFIIHFDRKHVTI